MKEEIKVYKESRLPDGTLVQTIRKRLITKDNAVAVVQNTIHIYENLVTTPRGGSERYQCSSLEHAMDHHEHLVGQPGQSGSYLANDSPTRMDLILSEEE